MCIRDSAPEMQAVMRHCMIRRLKGSVLTQLPPKIREDITIPVPASNALVPKFERLDAIIAEMRRGDNLPKTMEFERKQLCAELFHETSKAKAEPVCAFLQQHLAGIDHRVIIFAHHIAMMDAIMEACAAIGKSTIRIDGSTPQAKRAGLVETFKERDVAVLSIGACGTGLNFTMCAHVIFAELDWNPGALLQAEDRTHRIGQSADSVLIQYLLGEGTLDTRVWRTLQYKFQTVNTILDDGNDEGFDSRPRKKPRV